jgi:hypothetical protein
MRASTGEERRGFDEELGRPGRGPGERMGDGAADTGLGELGLPGGRRDVDVR